MRKLLFLSMMTLASAGLIITGCKKDPDPVDNDTQASADNAAAENTFDDVFKSVDDAAQSMGLNKTSSCPTVTVDTNASPRTLILDFGTVNCMGADSKNRRGKIIVTWTGRFRDAGTVWTTSFDNFFINDNKVEGTKSVTNNGRNTAGNHSFTVNISNAKITFAGTNETILWNATRTREWIAGENTPFNIFDDKYSFTGNSSGTNRKGQTFTAMATKAVIIDLSCKYLVTSGTIDVTPQGKLVRTVDYGPGTCDDQATVTINGTSYPFTMK
jgi:hypothetical protein